MATPNPKWQVWIMRVAEEHGLISGGVSFADEFLNAPHKSFMKEVYGIHSLLKAKTLEDEELLLFKALFLCCAKRANPEGAKAAIEQYRQAGGDETSISVMERVARALDEKRPKQERQLIPDPEMARAIKSFQRQVQTVKTGK
jgi:hypothetical protein